MTAAWGADCRMADSGRFGEWVRDPPRADIRQASVRKKNPTLHVQRAKGLVRANITQPPTPASITTALSTTSFATSLLATSAGDPSEIPAVRDDRDDRSVVTHIGGQHDPT